MDHPSDKALVDWTVTAPAGYQVVANGRLAEETDARRRHAHHALGGRAAHRDQDRRHRRRPVRRGPPPPVVAAGVPVDVETWAYPEDRAAGFTTSPEGRLGPRRPRRPPRAVPVRQAGQRRVHDALRRHGERRRHLLRRGRRERDAARTPRRSSTRSSTSGSATWSPRPTGRTSGSQRASRPTSRTSTPSARAGVAALQPGLARDRDRIVAFAAENPQRMLVDTTFADPNELLNAYSYQRGSWTLHLLRRRLGDDAFFAGLRAYLARHADGNATTADLRAALEAASGQDLRAFFETWTRRPGLPRVDATWRVAGGRDRRDAAPGRRALRLPAHGRGDRARRPRGPRPRPSWPATRPSSASRSPPPPSRSTPTSMRSPTSTCAPSSRFPSHRPCSRCSAPASRSLRSCSPRCPPRRSPRHPCRRPRPRRSVAWPRRRPAHVMTPELLWQLHRVGGPAVSPDGRSVVYSVTVPDMAANRSATQLWRVPRPAARPPAHDRGPQLGPAVAHRQPPRDPLDARRLLAGVDHQRRRDRAPRHDGRRGRRGRLQGSPTGGRRVALVMRVQVDSTLAALYPDLPLAEARRYDDLMMRHWNAWADGTYSHLFVADIGADGTAARPATCSPASASTRRSRPSAAIEQIAWHPDGERIVYTAKLTAGTAYAISTNSDLFLVDLRSGTTTNLTEGMMGYDVEPAFSPDGRRMAWNSMATDGYEADRNRSSCVDIASGPRPSSRPASTTTPATRRGRPTGGRCSSRPRRRDRPDPRLPGAAAARRAASPRASFNIGASRSAGRPPTRSSSPSASPWSSRPTSTA